MFIIAAVITDFYHYCRVTVVILQVYYLQFK